MVTAPLRIAIVGTNIGCTLHVRALRAAGFEVTTLIGRDPARTAAAAARERIASSSVSFEAVLDSGIDAIVIATPPESHHPMVMAALAAGKHVLCEKPFSIDVGRAREMRDAAREAGLIGQLVHQLRWFGHAGAVRALVASGAIGAPLHGSFLFDHVIAARGVADMPDWWFHRDRGGGWLNNYASHGIDLLRFMVGEIESVAATLHADLGRAMTADDSYAVLVRMANGMQGVMAGSCRSWDTCDGSRLLGETATVSFDSQQVIVTDAGGRRIAWPPQDADPAEAPAPVPAGEDYHAAHASDYGAGEQAALARSFRRRIEQRDHHEPRIATFDDGVAHMEVIVAVTAAAASGRWVNVRA